MDALKIGGLEPPNKLCIDKASNAYSLATLMMLLQQTIAIALDYYILYSRLSSGRTFHISIIEK